MIEQVESLADYQNRMQNLIAINRQIHDLYKKATELTDEEARARIGEYSLNPDGTLDQLRDRIFRYEAKTFSRRLDVPWLASWDVLGEELPPGVDRDAIMFKPEIVNRRRERKPSIPGGSPTKRNTGKQSGKSGSLELGEKAGDEETANG